VHFYSTVNPSSHFAPREKTETSGKEIRLEIPPGVSVRKLYFRQFPYEHTPNAPSNAPTHFAIIAVPACR
jgi:hypothetical protein